MSFQFTMNLKCLKTLKRNANALNKSNAVLLTILNFYFTINCYKYYIIVSYVNTFIKYFSKSTNILPFWTDLYSAGIFFERPNEALSIHLCKHFHEEIFLNEQLLVKLGGLI